MATERAAPTTVEEAIGRGLAYLARLQTAEGSWRGDYDGPLFLLPGYVFAYYATGTPLPDEHCRGFAAYIKRVQNPDGGFGLHVEGDSLVFTTALNYVALRLLGVESADPTARRARAWLLNHGGALGIPSWGKYWLALLRLYDWRAVNPVPPELWLLPRWFPLHPGRFWCHARMVYLPVSYLYGRRWRVPEAPILAELRDELYNRPYREVDFHRARELVAPTDLYTPHSPLLRRLNDLLVAAERLVPRWLRRRALARALAHVKHENQVTDFLDLGPVSKAFDVLAVYAAEPAGAHTRRAIERLPAYLFPCAAGLTMLAYHSSELWDTAFVGQALAASGQADRFSAMAAGAHRFVDTNQVRRDVPDAARHYRDRTRGGWPFSTAAQGWPVSDCTAEAMLAALALEPWAERPIPRERLTEAVDRLLEWQNPDGGWPTYERSRGNRLLELANPSEIFAGIMIDYSYPELTSSVIQGLLATRERLPSALGPRRLARIERALARGERYLRRTQRPDGSWEGSWGICFTYGTWFGVAGLRALGAAQDDPAVRRSVEFLLARQLADGGWSESYRSCLRRAYVHHPDGGQVVMTSWALLALLLADDPRAADAIGRGVRFLLERQLPDGDWPQASVTGVFNRTCMLNYRFYRDTFPIWALGLARQRAYGEAAPIRPA